MKARIVPVRSVIAGLLLGLVLGAGSARAAGSKALGTLTVKGKTTILKNVVATRESDPEEEGRTWLVILATDVPVAPADRSPERLKELAADGKVRGVRILWAEGVDRVEVVPYHPNLETSGTRGGDRPTLNLKGSDEKRVNAEFRSKMVGQSWHFHADVNAPVTSGGTLELEPEATDSDEAPLDDASPSTRKKVALGKLGYEYTPEMFVHAVSDGNLEAVRAFLELGMSANTKSGSRDHVLVLAAQSCGADPKEDRGAIVEALLAAKADVKAADQNGSTALLWAVSSCPVGTVKALVAAGANVNARARGGATPLMMAEFGKRDDVVAILKRAGAKK